MTTVESGWSWSKSYARASCSSVVRGFHRHAQCVFRLVVAEASPGGVHLGEDDGPLIFVGNHVQTVSAGRQRLAFNRDRIAEGDGRVLVGAGAPDLAIRHKSAPNLAAVGQRAMIVDGDVGNADALRHDGVLAGTRQVELSGLSIGECSAQQQARHEEKEAKLVHGTHLIHV